MFWLVGYSLGGNTALNLAAKRPKIVKALFICGAGSPPPKAGKRI